MDFTLSWAYPPEISESFMTATVLVSSAVSPGVYASWCVDAQTGLLPGIEGYEYVGNVYSSTDTNLNQYLVGETANTNSLVGPEVWKSVNYILNHRVGYDYWDVQGAIWHFIGGPAVSTPAYPGFNLAAVSQLISDTISNAPAWVSQPGDKVAAVAVIVWPVDTQIVIIEVPCPETTPGLALSVNCPTACGLVDFAGSVSNSGNVTLTNVHVFSSQPSENTLVAGPISLTPGASATFTGNYILPCITNLSTNTVSIVTTNTVGVISTNTVFVVTTNIVGVVTTNSITVITTNTVPFITTNTVLVITTNAVGVVITNTVLVITTNTVPFITTNTVLVITTNMVPVVTTNTVLVISTNTTVTITTNQSGTIPSPGGAATFGTISPAGSIGTVTDRFVVGTAFHGLTYSDSDHGYAATKFYSIHQDIGANASFFDTIAPTGGTGTITDRFPLPQYEFDALTYAAPDVGYGPIIFYYLRHDADGRSSFGSITPGGVVGVTVDHKVVGTNFVALTFSATDVGYGANLFYYVRRDANCNSIFGTIDPAQGGPVTDRFPIGPNVDSLVFTSTDVGYGANNFYYLRHDGLGNSTFGTIFVTGLTSGNVNDRFSVGTNATELTFTPTDVLYGPNLFYYLRGTAKAGCSTFTTNTVTTFSTNEVTNLTTNNVTSFVTNSVTSFTTNYVTSFTTNSVTSFSTNLLTSFTTNTVTSFTTNIVTSFTTNSVTSFTTNTVSSFTTNSVTSFSTNLLTSFTTNTVTSFTTNIVAAAFTNTVTASGTDACQGRIVTAAATCSGTGSPPNPLVIGGSGVAPLRYSSGDVSLSFGTQSGVTYIVQFKRAMSDPAWTDLQTVAGTGGIVTIPHDMRGQAACFYRVVMSR